MVPDRDHWAAAWGLGRALRMGSPADRLQAPSSRFRLTLGPHTWDLSCGPTASTTAGCIRVHESCAEVSAKTSDEACMERSSDGHLRAIGFAFWLIAATFAASTLTAWHSVSLPLQPERSKPRGGHGNGWHLTHYLSPNCACSRAIARYLIARGTLSKATEEIVFIGSSDIPAENGLLDALNRRGFHITSVSAETAAEEGVEGVPILKIEAPDGSIRFRGGYRERSTPPEEYLDVAILSGLIASQPVPNPRAYGCATSRRMRSLLDPLSLKSL
jgi:hypothetical protein